LSSGRKFANSLQRIRAGEIRSFIDRQVKAEGSVAGDPSGAEKLFNGTAMSL